jgi:hypothetical protein
MYMKKIIYISYALLLTLSFNACDQEVIELQPPIQPPLYVACPDDATAGSADFSKYIAIGNSLTAGYQAGALFDEGQENSLGNILAHQFECVGGGTFNQPDINTQNGFFTGGTNPVGNVVLGRLLLQGTPPAPAPTISTAAAIPNPIVNPGFIYPGDRTKLNNFGVPGITLLHIFAEETGDWANSAHPLFNPFYARFASDGGQGTSTILGDAVAALANEGTFFSFWLGSNDVLGYAIGGASNPGIFTPINADPNTGHPGFTNLFGGAIQTILSVPEIKGVVGNIPDVLRLPYFHLIPYNAIPLAQANASALNEGFAGYNSILDALKGPPFNLSAAEMDSRKIAFAEGANNIVITDETLSDLGPYFDGLLAAEVISAGQRAALDPYRRAREANASDFLTLSSAIVLGTTVGGNPQLINGLTIPLGDQYVLLPSEQSEITERIAAFNQIIAATVSGLDRIAFADVNARYNQFYTAGLEIHNGVSVTPTMPPPTGLVSEDGVHANSRGMAYTANIFIDAINAKFGAKVPKANLANYKATALPSNP